MLKQYSIDVNFGGDLKSMSGNVQMQSRLDALKKGCLSCLFVWAVGVVFVVVPFAAWTLPFIFFGVGPIVGIITYFMDRHEVHLMQASAVCPACQSDISINESNFRPPTYGSCKQCGLPYQIDIQAKKLAKTKGSAEASSR